MSPAVLLMSTRKETKITNLVFSVEIRITGEDGRINTGESFAKVWSQHAHSFFDSSPNNKRTDRKKDYYLTDIMIVTGVLPTYLGIVIRSVAEGFHNGIKFDENFCSSWSILIKVAKAKLVENTDLIINTE